MTDSVETPIKMTEILVALDHSSHSRAALESAAFIAQLMEARIHGLFVHDKQWLRISKLPSLSEIDELTGQISPMGRESVEKEIRELEKAIKEHFELISRQHELNHRWSTLKGAVTEKVLEAAKDCDIITIGSKGRSYLKPTKLGSTAASIIRQADKPVLILKKSHQPGDPPAAVFDGSKQSLSGVKIAVELAKKHDSRPVVIDLSSAFTSTEYGKTDLTDLNKINTDLEILTLEKPDMGRFLFLLSRLRFGLLILPKNDRFIKRNSLEHILESADCPILLAT